VLDHVTIRVADRAASRRFYDTVLAPLGHARSYSGGDFDEWNDFGIAAAGAGWPATRRLHVGFAARSRDDVDAFWRAGVEAGYESDGEPGLRPEYHETYYGGFLRDPDGLSAEAVYHGWQRSQGNAVDHLWIRVADLDASKRFWEAVGPTLALSVRESDLARRVHVEAGDRSFALVPGPPTENVHLAFPAPADAVVARFHRAALAAGHRDNGPPGERPEYHPGYFAAYVLDPDGNNIEAVNHRRRVDSPRETL
jgi:catechol 2,3-dioxygenase-like lactoylglutathione lyase family enzyme